MSRPHDLRQLDLPARTRFQREVRCRPSEVHDCVALAHLISPASISFVPAISAHVELADAAIRDWRTILRLTHRGNGLQIRPAAANVPFRPIAPVARCVPVLGNTPPGVLWVERRVACPRSMVGNVLGTIRTNERPLGRLDPPYIRGTRHDGPVDAIVIGGDSKFRFVTYILPEPTEATRAVRLERTNPWPEESDALTFGAGWWGPGGFIPDPPVEAPSPFRIGPDPR